MELMIYHCGFSLLVKSKKKKGERRNGKARGWREMEGGREGGMGGEGEEKKKKQGGRRGGRREGGKGEEDEVGREERRRGREKHKEV